jgi:hypothetical protein
VVIGDWTLVNNHVKSLRVMEEEKKDNTEKEVEVKYNKFFDDEGNEVEALSKEQAEALLKQEEERKAELQSEVQKLKDKDFNFKAFRDARKEEREKMKEQLSEKEKQILEMQEESEGRIDKIQSNLIKDYKEDILESLVGEDEDLRKKIEYNFDRIKGEAETKAQIKNKLLDAYKLSTDNPVENPLSSVSHTTNSGEIQRKKEGGLSEEDKKALKDQAGFSDEDLEKYAK